MPFVCEEDEEELLKHTCQLRALRNGTELHANFNPRKGKLEIINFWRMLRTLYTSTKAIRIMLSNKLGIEQLDLKDKRVLIRYHSKMFAFRWVTL